jgi:hypothetical protein
MAAAKVRKRKRIGSNFEDFLRERRRPEEATAAAHARIEGSAGRAARQARAAIINVLGRLEWDSSYHYKKERSRR